MAFNPAAIEGHLEVVRLLLDAGADVEGYGYERDHWTALMEASWAGHLLMVKLLVARDADVNAWVQGETPLMLAAQNLQHEVYQFLYPLVSADVRAIGDRDAEKEMAKTSRKRAREQNRGIETLISMAKHGKLSQVENLIANGFDINTIGSCNRTALSVAIQGGYIPVIQALLNAGANPNLSDETEYGLPANSPLMEAASNFFLDNRCQMVRLLLKKGADINQQDAEGRTALMCSLDHSDMDVLETLIKAGADLDVKDYEGNTALMQAVYRELLKPAHRLKQAGASEQRLKEVELVKAATQGNLERVNILLQDCLDLNLRVGRTTTALCEAAHEGHHEIVKRLIAAGADIDRSESEGSFNPLLYAAYDGHQEVVQLLMEAGANVHVRVKDSLNPIEYAELGQCDNSKHNIAKPFDAVIALLEQYGATRS
jgi:ankyrin repeat protein